MSAHSALPPPEQKRAFVQAMFDRIAPRYDFMNRVISLGLDRGWRRRGLQRIALRPGDRVVDLAAGTGDFAELARAHGARPIAMDLARGMLQQAQRVRPQLSLVQADAVALPLRSASADAVTCGFALRNFADLPGMLAECARVLRPGGALLLLEVDAPRSRWLSAAHALHFRHLVPALGRWLSESDAYRYLPESTAFLPDETALAELIADAGFEAPQKHRHAFGAVQCLIARRRPQARA